VSKKRRQEKKIARTGTNVEPVGIKRRELLRDTSLGVVHPLGKAQLASALQVSGVLADKVLSRDILDGDAEAALLLLLGSGLCLGLSSSLRGHLGCRARVRQAERQGSMMIQGEIGQGNKANILGQ
jgi:hypothetical protein